jgi:hypothetical protein
MKDANDTKTQELIPAAPRKRGRPATGQAKSGAERQAAYLAKKKSETVTVTFNRDDIPALRLVLANLTPNSDSDLDKETIERLWNSVFNASYDQQALGKSKN